MQLSAYEKLNRSNETHRSSLALLVLHLSAGDLVAAMRAYDGFSQYVCIRLWLSVLYVCLSVRFVFLSFARSFLLSGNPDL